MSKALLTYINTILNSVSVETGFGSVDTHTELKQVT
jgi:hypothetical protein